MMVFQMDIFLKRQTEKLGNHIIKSHNILILSAFILLRLGTGCSNGHL